MVSNSPMRVHAKECILKGPNAKKYEIIYDRQSKTRKKC